MSAKGRAGVVAGVMASALLLAGNNHGAGAPKANLDPPLSVRIVGEWTSDPFVVQIEKATQAFCFRADGSVAVRTETQAGPRSSSGTYKLDADRITLQLASAGSSLVLKVSWSAERLVLTDQSGQARSYRPTSKEC